MIYVISRQTTTSRKVYPLEILNQLSTAKKIGYDFETTDLDVFTLVPILLSLTDEKQDTYIIDLLTYDCKEVGLYIADLIPGKLWIAHNSAFDMGVLKVHMDIEIDQMENWCTMVSAQVLYNGTETLDFGYDDLVAFYFKQSISKTIRNTFINRDLSLPITEGEINYVATDTKWLIPLQEIEEEKLRNKNMLSLITEIEGPFTAVLTEMRISGINVDTWKWHKNAQKFLEEAEEAREKVRELFIPLTEIHDFTSILIPAAKKKKAALQGLIPLFENKEVYSQKELIKKFNPASSDQVKLILNAIGIRVKSTGAEILDEELLKWDEGIQRNFMLALLDFREKNKRASSYSIRYLDHLHRDTGRIHGNFTQAFTDTGRLSSSKPNLQNIEADEDIRGCFIPDTPDHVFVDCDFSGQELRIAAAYSLDPKLIDSQKGDFDLHSYLATGTYKIVKNDPDFVVSSTQNSKLRTNHKRNVFGHMYGCEAPRHAKILKVTLKVAEQVQKWLRKSMPTFTKYQDLIKYRAVKDGFIFDGTIYNRRKLFRGFRKKAMSDQKIESEGANFPIQATAATMSKQAMIETHRYIKSNKLHLNGGALKLAVHDEIIFQLHKKDIEHAEHLVTTMKKVGTSYLRGVLEMESSFKIAEYWQK